VSRPDIQGVECSVEAAKEDALSQKRWRRVEQRVFIRCAGPEAPDNFATLPVEREQLVGETHRQQHSIEQEKVGGSARSDGGFPSKRSGLALKGIDVGDCSGAPKIASGEDERIRDNRISVKLEGTAFFPCVVEPYERPRPPIEAAKEAVTRPDEDEIPRDRGGRKDSPARVERP
jgi:hypothetical protein